MQVRVDVDREEWAAADDPPLQAGRHTELLLQQGRFHGAVVRARPGSLW